MDRKLWGVGVMVIGLFVAAWIVMDLEKRHWQHTEKNIHTMIAETDSLAHPGRKATPLERERRRSGYIVDEVRQLSGDLTQRTDTLKKVISEEHLLDSDPSQGK
jgi:hypothetical protein